MFEVFAEMVLERFESMDLENGVRAFRRALLGNDGDGMTAALRDMLESSVSFRILGHETSYQLFMVGLLMNLYGNYRITADFESGDGCHDIRMERLRGNGPNVIVEVKRANQKDTPAELAERALRQIVEKDYTHGLKGETVLYGVAFDGKRPTVVSTTVRLRRDRCVNGVK